MSWAWLSPGPVSGRSHAVSGSPVVPVVSVSPVEVGPVSAVVASVVSVEVSAAKVKGHEAVRVDLRAATGHGFQSAVRTAAVSSVGSRSTGGGVVRPARISL